MISNGDAKVVSIDTPNSGVAEKALAMAPDLIDKITALFGKDEKEEADQQQDDIAVDDQPQQESDDNN